MPEQAKAVTGRPNDIVAGEVSNSTFASRRAQRADVDDKQVKADDSKRGRKVDTKKTEGTAPEVDSDKK